MSTEKQIANDSGATNSSRLIALEQRLGARWPNIVAGRELAQAARSQLKSRLSGIDSEDTSTVVFGSLARDEFTSDSDIDWTLLIDGSADPVHLELARNIDDIITGIGHRPPGREGTFGKMAFSHEIIHRIGGEDDTNQNTTRRILLLLESSVVGRPDAYERVCNNVLDRYVRGDRGFCHGAAQYSVPRFLLNDFARYWRTVAVDFAYKQRTRFGEGWAIRNIKLRMSRKLIYVSGLLVCFSFHLGYDEGLPPLRCEGADGPPECIERLRVLLRRTPLDILANTVLRYEHLWPTGLKLFNAYDAFLGMLGDKATREHLENLPPDADLSDDIFQTARKLSHDFRDGLMDLFFDEKTDLGKLTKMYGVF